MTNKILAGNWKMNKSRTDVRSFFTALGEQSKWSSVRKIISTSPTLLETSVQAAQNSGVDIFAQNVHWKNSGAFTGESSPVQLKDIGVTGSLVGHSERRQFFGESEQSAADRCQGAIEEGLEVIFCFGEELKDREANRTEEVVKAQLSPLLSLGSDKLQGKVIFAYEPVWAIGTGLTASPEQISETHRYIHSLLIDAGLESQILYGGSVKPNNFKEISDLDHVSGGLVGGASLEAESFLSLHTCLK